jgi:uncharacterized membrane protein
MLPVPALLVVAAVLMQLGLAHVDRRLPPDALPEFLRLTPDAAVALLSTIAGATITTVGVVFSLIVVSLQLASGQFSPRVMRGFFREPLGKVLIGLLAAVFVYAVLALKAVRTGRSGEADVPDLTVDGALLLTLVAVGVMVTYLQRVGRHQYVGFILEDIAEETLRRLADLQAHARAYGRPGVQAPDPATLGTPHVVPGQRSGWVQQVSGAGLLAAVPPGSVVRLETRPGAFVVRGAPLASVWPPRGSAPRPDMERRVQRSVDVGDVRTMQEDVDFGLRQLVDVALRALSPAVNDPTTAVEAILRLVTILRPLLTSPLPPQVRVDSRGSVLLRPWDLDHAELVRHAFDELRQTSAPHPRVALALVRSYRMLMEALDADATPDGPSDARGELRRQLRLTLEGCARANLLPEDLERVVAAARWAHGPSHADPSLGMH